MTINAKAGQKTVRRPNSAADMTAVQLIEAYKAKTLSPVQVVEDVLARMEASEPKVHAMWALDPEAALDAARQSEQRWNKGIPSGVLDGVPITIKDNIATRGVAIPLGTAATKLVPATEDGPSAARSREAGAVIVGKTTMPDYGMMSSGLSTFHELARNPWNLATNPGGSSAGAGSAAAIGYGPLHIGTDIGGSIRLPASWCGIVGFKPSFGRVPVDPPYIGRAVGPMTRTVADSALLMSVISKPDRRDTTSLPYEKLDWLDLDMKQRNVRIAMLLEAGAGMETDPEIVAAVEASAEIFRSVGFTVDIIKPFLTSTMLYGLDRFLRTRSWLTISKLSPEIQDKVEPWIREWVEPAGSYTGEDVFTGFSQVDATREAMLDAMRDYDFLISPVTPVSSFPAEWGSPTNDPQRAFDHVAYTIPGNMSGQPGISINCGYAGDGAPIGLQIMGQRFDDLGVLRMAQLFERLRPEQRPWPTV
ncbi:amidase (plasmid) [Agrobacterium leguminum]|uniref:Amidase n=1 Tax=Agrobacterium deltaense NCPPB 1641 TaxID=1183425 RepID=A0A1S7UB01_9HYPH|nr:MULTISPECIES: amidase [Agrobacterium]WFS69754.1 amidase [Agrobacterium leguminum]CVI64064.1 putative amidase [Agrobacterium deltaense NCPPB 1641]